MTLHYHVTPITPNHQLMRLAGRCFLVRYGRHDQLELVRQIASSILYDNGAFGFYTEAMKAFERDKAAGLDVQADDYIRVSTDWNAYYAWIDPLLDNPTSWAIVPDVIGASSQEQDALLKQWPHGKERAAPVWHMDEPIDRLLRLLDEWPRVCIGSTGEYWRIWLPGREGVDLDPAWEARQDKVWEALERRFRRTPYVHMLRGMATLGRRWPFASGDSSDAGQNGHRTGGPMTIVERADKRISPDHYTPPKRSKQLDLLAGGAL